MTGLVEGAALGPAEGRLDRVRTASTPTRTRTPSAKAAFVRAVGRRHGAPRSPGTSAATTGATRASSPTEGARVVALDSDQGPVELLYRDLRAAGDERVLAADHERDRPVARPGLARRGAPAARCARPARARPLPGARASRDDHRQRAHARWIDWLAELGASLVIEFPTREDPMVQRLLAAKKEGTHPDYERATFERCLGDAFEVERSEIAGLGYARALPRPPPRAPGGRVSRALRDGLGRRALELAVLCAFAFAQPLFDLLGRNPEFFAVRGSPSGDIVLFAVGLVLLPPLVLTGVEALAGLAGPRARDAVHAVLVALLGALIAIQVVKRIGALPAGLDLALALAVGLALAWATGRAPRARGADVRHRALARPRCSSSRSSCSARRATQLVLPEHAEVATAERAPGRPGGHGRLRRVPADLAAGPRRPDRPRALPQLRHAGRALDVVLPRDDGVRLDDARRARDPRRAPAPRRARCPRSPSTRATSSRSSAGPTASTSPRRPRTCARGRCARTSSSRAWGGDCARWPSTPASSTPTSSLPAALEDSLPSISEGWGDFHGGDAGRRGARAAGRRRAPGALRGVGALDPAVVAARR